MSVKPELAFDVCWEVYKNAKEVLEAKRGISALKVSDAATKFSSTSIMGPALASTHARLLCEPSHRAARPMMTSSYPCLTRSPARRGAPAPA